MDENNKLNKINKSIFLMALFLTISRKYIIYFVSRQLPLGKVLSIMLYLSLALFLVQFLINKNRSKKGIFFLITACVVFVMTKEGAILALMLMALGMEFIDDKFTVKSFLLIHIALFIGSMIFTAFFPDLAQHQEIHYRIVDGLNVARYNFGAGNPNFILLVLLPVYACYIYLRYENYNIWDRILLLVSLYIVYINTYSRTGLITIIAGLIFVEILRKVDVKDNKIVKAAITFSPVLITLSSIGTALFLYKNNIANKLLSSRPTYWYIYIKKEGKLFNLFGNKYTSAMREQNPADNSYIYIVAVLGMVTLLLLLWILCKGLNEYCKRNMKKNIVVVVMFLIFSFGENILIDAGLNFAIILLIKDVIVFNSKTVNIYKYPIDTIKKITNRRAI